MSLRNLRKMFGDWYRWNVQWRHIPRAQMISELALNDWGGCYLQIVDINDDRTPEFLWLQSTGVYKSKLFTKNDSAWSSYISTHMQDLFCLTATNQSGDIIWQVGQPYNGAEPYPSLAPEKTLCCYDVDGDNHTEVLALNGANELWILDGRTGAKKNSVQLPADNFTYVTCGRSNYAQGETVILVGTMDRPYPPHQYANPWIFLNSKLQVIHCGEYLGAGHHIAVFDANRDGCDEFLVGYQLVAPNGNVLWTVDQWENKAMDPVHQHVDHVNVYWTGNDWFAIIAGSDRVYCIDNTGHVLWDHELPHPQFCIVGEQEFGTRVFVLNQRECMNCFDIHGNSIWTGLLPENWPMGRPPKAFGRRPIHCLVPASLLRIGQSHHDLILYKEGGWPYAVDFCGEPQLMFPYTQRSKKPDVSSPFGRINDVGMYFEAAVYDLDRDGCEEIIIYDRHYAWLYTIPELLRDRFLEK